LCGLSIEKKLLGPLGL